MGYATSYNTKTGAFTYRNQRERQLGCQLAAGFSRSIDKQHRFRFSADAKLGYVRSVDFDIDYDNKGAELSKVNTWSPSEAQA